MTENSNVITIRGGVLPQPGTPDDNVVAALEEALEKARSGEIIGAVMIFTHSDDCTSSELTGRFGRQALGLTACVMADMVERLRTEK